uniref:Type IV pilus biogenesis n=1 Tax=Candidatus Kentrum sp. DK TaxID=2126562 RepID=A0A450RTK4_9GAMM|nr:MAG: Type IV pilus biogenesis [Candidatus Kentron sp. DK]
MIKAIKTSHRLLPVLAGILLSGGIGYTLLEGFYPATAGNGNAGNGVAVPRARDAHLPATPKGSEELAREIARLHLFGTPPGKDAPAPPPPVEKAPETTLKLTLRGIIASEGEEDFAIIADEKGKQDNYAPGEELFDGVSLLSIHDDYVVLRRGDRFETLRMPDESDTGPDSGPYQAHADMAMEFLPGRVSGASGPGRTGARSPRRRIRNPRRAEARAR